MDIFSSSYLLEHYGHLKVDIRTQIQQNPDFNIEDGKETWNCSSPVGQTTIAAYVKYQEKFARKESRSPTPTPKQLETIDFCTNIDLGDFDE